MMGQLVVVASLRMANTFVPEDQVIHLLNAKLSLINKIIHINNITVYFFSPDGTIRIWNPKTGKCKHSFTGHFAHTGAVTSMCSSVDGDLLLTGKTI